MSHWNERDFSNASDIHRANRSPFAFGPFKIFLTIFDRSRLQKRSETVEMQTDPNSERPETPRNVKWETFTK
jgi:hypothetical protein